VVIIYQCYDVLGEFQKSVDSISEGLEIAGEGGEIVRENGERESVYKVRDGLAYGPLARLRSERASDPAVAHHERHIRSALATLADIRAVGDSIPADLREESQSMRDMHSALALDMYWCHARRMCEIVRGEYR
jgi:hypothetical protein